MQSLREAIDRERRVIKCLEAQLAYAYPLLHRPQSQHYASAKANTGDNERSRDEESERRSCTSSGNDTRRKLGEKGETSEDAGGYEKQRKQQVALLDFLDMLGSQSMNVVSSSIQQLLNENSNTADIDVNADPITYCRIMPLMSGIYFTHISPPMPCNNKSNSLTRDARDRLQNATAIHEAKYRLYEVKGGVLPEIGSLTFCISLLAISSSNVATKRNTTTFTTCMEGFKIEKLNVEYERTMTPSLRDLQRCILYQSTRAREGHNGSPSSANFPTEELGELTSLAKRTRNVTKLFRDIISFAEFDAHRTSTLLELHNIYGQQDRFIVLSPNKVRIKLFSGNTQDVNDRKEKHNTEKSVLLGSIDVVWKWKFSLLSSRGTDELWVESIQVAPNLADPRATYRVLTELKERGVNDLLSSLEGDCSQALKLLIKATSS